MGRLGLNRLLQIMLVPPLLALTAFGGLLILDTLGGYREIDRLSALEQFVSAAGRLAITALNQESIATQSYVALGSEAQRAEMSAAQQRSDEAIRLFRETAASAGLLDPKAIKLVVEIEQYLGGLKGFRARADARTLQRRESGDLVQPITAALGDLFHRIAVLLNHHQLRELLLGLHAIMQMNDGQRTEGGRTELALRDGPLDAGTFQNLLLGLSKQAIFGKEFDDFGPAGVRDRLREFAAGPDSRAIESLRPAILAINNGGKVSEADAKRWRDAMAERNRVWSGAVAATLEELTTTTEVLRESARWRLVLYVAMCLFAVILVMTMSRWVLRKIRRLL